MGKRFDRWGKQAQSLIRPLCYAAGALCIGAQAHAHDQWADASPVPAWVKAACCGPADVHHLDSSDVHVTAAGYVVAGYRAPIPLNSLTPSPDGEWWVFYRNYPDGTQSSVYCFFGPTQGS